MPALGTAWLDALAALWLANGLGALPVIFGTPSDPDDVWVCPAWGLLLPWMFAAVVLGGPLSLARALGQTRRAQNRAALAARARRAA